MKCIISLFQRTVCLLAIGCVSFALAGNQTPEVSRVLSDKDLPFRVRIEQDKDFNLPFGLQGYVSGEYEGLWLLLTGSTEGPESPPVADTAASYYDQNTTIFVIDPTSKKVLTRSLTDPSSGLTQQQIDILSAKGAQSLQIGKTLYVVGGWGIDNVNGEWSMKDSLTAIDLPGIIHWVSDPTLGESAAQYIRQISDPIFSLTRGAMTQLNGHPILLIFGQSFEGLQYVSQVQRFQIHDDGVALSIEKDLSKPLVPEDHKYRRCNLNVVPIVKRKGGTISESFLALSGVYTLSEAPWTVPVEIAADGTPSMADPKHSSTFKQGMNQFNCANFGLFSEKSGEMFTILAGGRSFGFFEKSKSRMGALPLNKYAFKTVSAIPFVNQTSAIRINKQGRLSQHFLREGGFPFISAVKKRPLYFGMNAQVKIFSHIPTYSNGVIRLDAIHEPTVIGYIIGGVQSANQDPNDFDAQAASPRLFRVIVEPRRKAKPQCSCRSSSSSSCSSCSLHCFSSSSSSTSSGSSSSDSCSLCHDRKRKRKRHFNSSSSGSSFSQSGCSRWGSSSSSSD